MSGRIAQALQGSTELRGAMRGGGGRQAIEALGTQRHIRGARRRLIGLYVGGGLCLMRRCRFYGCTRYRATGAVHWWRVRRGYVSFAGRRGELDASGTSERAFRIHRGANVRDDELPALCAYAWERDLTPRFIEQMPMADGELFVPGAFMGAAEIRSAIASAHRGARLVAEPAWAGQGAGPARYWRVEGNRGFEGRFGVISPLTEHFCDTCNRVRLSATGALHTCLAFDDATDLRQVLRDRGEEGVVETIRAALTGKRDGHTFGLVGIGGPRKAMIQIGG
jgi:hypothetical protein